MLSAEKVRGLRNGVCASRQPSCGYTRSDLRRPKHDGRHGPLLPGMTPVSIFLGRLAGASPSAPSVGPLYATSQVSNTGILLNWMLCLASLVPVGAAAYVAWKKFLESHEAWFVQKETIEELPPMFLYGVDVSQSAFLSRPDVQKAVHFAARAHEGQQRKTGEPYVVHCIETAVILEDLLSPLLDDARAECAIMAAILHDVLDDTDMTTKELNQTFGVKVASLVQQVSKLSSMIQLLRRHRRTQEEDGSQDESSEGSPGQWKDEDQKLKSTILKALKEPLVLLIKLSDRLHNMRTVYALKPKKRRAVALETQRIFCTLAERLGLFALKAELEDLCFAVLQPQDFCRVRHDLQQLWGLDRVQSDDSSAASDDDFEELSDVSSSPPVLSYLGVSRVAVPAVVDSQWECEVNPANLQERVHNSLNGTASISGTQDDHVLSSRALSESGCTCSSCSLSWEHLETDQCEELLSYVTPFTSVMFSWSGPGGDMGFGLNFLRDKVETLLGDVAIASYGAGFNVEVYGRVKSLWSSYNKMKRKNATVKDVYDVLALRVVVDDSVEGDGARTVCYRLLSTVQRLWKQLPSELDDYIANPKDSGYQSLHTAVIGPEGVPFEVQIRTSTMHEDAEYGTAAHWCYKENGAPLTTAQALPVGDCGMCRVGQPVIRIRSGSYLDGVILGCENEGRHILVAVYLRKRLPKRAGSRAASRRRYEDLLKYVEERGWFQAAQGDFYVALERYVLCVDGAYHRVDHYGHKQSTIVRPINVSDVDLLASFDEDVDLEVDMRRKRKRPARGVGKFERGNTEMDEMKERVRYLRSMLEFCQDMVPVPESEDVYVLVWPDAKIQRFPRGTTAGQVVHSKGLIEIDDGSASDDFVGECTKLVNVNNQLVPEETPLRDGDTIILAREKVKI